MKIQLALDVLDIKEGLSIARKVSNAVDIIEAGTPFIKAEGMRAVSELKKAFPKKKILADMKTMDTGFLEVKMAAEAGADMVSVLAASPENTIREAVRAGKEFGVEVMADLIGVEDKAKRAARMTSLGVDCIVLHTGIDEQKERDPLIGLQEIMETVKCKVAVAGGIDPEKAKRLDEMGVDIAIVGGFITRSKDPAGNAMRIRSVLRE